MYESNSSKLVLSHLLAAGLGALGLFAMLRFAQQSELRGLLKSNYKLLTPKDKRVAQFLVHSGQSHLLSSWPQLGVQDSQKRILLQQAAMHFGRFALAAEAQRLEVLQAPKTEQRPKTLLQQWGSDKDAREDPYYWLRDDDRKDPAVLAHLGEENKYTAAVMQDTEQLQERLFQEMKSKIKEADQSAPVRYGPYYYYTRTEEGQQYSVRCRRKLPPGIGKPSESDSLDESMAEEVLLDENQESKKYGFYMVRGFKVSPNHQLLAYAEDTSGNEKYTLKVKELATGKMLLKAPIPDTAGSVTWAADNQTMFYVTKDKLDRPFKVWRHQIGTDPGDDALVYHEADEQFYVGIGKSNDEQLIAIQAGSAVTSETRYIWADKPLSDFTVIYPRRQDVEYGVDHRDGYFVVDIRDKQRFNSEVIACPVGDVDKVTVLQKHSNANKIEDIVIQQNYIAIFERRQGLQQAFIHKLPRWDAKKGPEPFEEGKQIKFEEPSYELTSGSSGDFDSDILRLDYTSLATPFSIIDYNVNTGRREVKKEQPVLGGFQKENYTTKRLMATAADGVKIPISIVYRDSAVKLDGSDPLVLSGYGAYEICNDPGFSSGVLSLLDRGFVYGIAHIRGGGELGRMWYEEAKYLKKKTTITDFIACTEYLVKEKYTSADRMCAEGRSAGGITMGGSVNMRPDLYAAVVLGVPFVDVLTTMLDETIPLTFIEFEEWGNPQDKTYYDYMKGYSPVDNVKAQDYPNMLITAGLNDPRVGYWEPAKFAALVRDRMTNKNVVMFKCDLGAGHFSKSGRFDKLRERALEYAFYIKFTGKLADEAQKSA